MATNTKLLSRRSHREQWGLEQPEEVWPFAGRAATAYLQLGMWAKYCQVF